MSRTIAIGDIHGCAVALNRLLQEISPEKSDTLIGIGDYVDRGSDSNGVIETLIGLMSQCQLVPLIGNHELMMFQGLLLALRLVELELGRDGLHRRCR